MHTGTLDDDNNFELLLERTPSSIKISITHINLPASPLPRFRPTTCKQSDLVHKSLDEHPLQPTKLGDNRGIRKERVTVRLSNLD